LKKEGKKKKKEQITNREESNLTRKQPNENYENKEAKKKKQRKKQTNKASAQHIQKQPHNPTDLKNDPKSILILREYSHPN